MYRIAICDDEEKILQDIQKKIENCFIAQNIEAEYFCTNDSEKMLAHIKNETVDFAYRPFGFVRKTHLDAELEELVGRIKQELKEKRQELTITKGQELIRIYRQDIVYIEAEGNYLNICTKREMIKVRDTMGNMENELKESGFVRCHKGYLVNVQLIEKMKGAQIELRGETENYSVPIGRSYEKDVKKKILELKD